MPYSNDCRTRRNSEKKVFLLTTENMTKRVEEKAPGWLMLCVLFLSSLLLNSFVEILFGYSQDLLREDFLVTEALFFAEITKLVISVTYIVISFPSGETESLVSHFSELIRSSLCLFPSAVFYLMLNYSYYFFVVYSNFLPSTIVLLFQLKFFSSFFLASFILKKKVCDQRRISMLFLLIGVILVSYALGSYLIATLSIIFLSGLGSVYFEYTMFDEVIQDRSGKIRKNFHLYFPSSVLTFLFFLMAKFRFEDQESQVGLLHITFPEISWSTIVCGFCWVLGSLVTSLEMSFGSSVVRSVGFSFIILATGVLSVDGVHSQSYSLPFGMALVILSFAIYHGFIRVPVPEGLFGRFLELLGVRVVFLDSNGMEKKLDENVVISVEVDRLRDPKIQWKHKCVVAPFPEGDHLE